MTNLTAVFAAALLQAGAAAGAQPDLAGRAGVRDGWFSWQVPLIAGAGVPCCYAFHAGHPHDRACDLEGRNWSTGSVDGPAPAGPEYLVIYAHATARQIDKVRAFGATCALRNTAQVRPLEGVTPADSIAFLAATSRQAGEELVDNALGAIALHAEDAATATLEQLADRTHSQHVREQALFWLAQERGRDGATFVEQVAGADADAELRAQAVFDLSEAHGIDAYASIHRIALNDVSEHVREQALFWMAQMRDARARDDIIAAIRSDASPHVREQGVFALSQLENGDADAALIALVRGSYPREVKQQALFWLGQSGSDAAIKFLDEVLTRKSDGAAKG